MDTIVFQPEQTTGSFRAKVGFDEGELAQVKKALLGQGAQVKIIGPHLGTLKGAKGTEIPADFSLLTAASVLFDALYIPGGTGNPGHRG